MQLVSTTRRRWFSGWKLFAVTVTALAAAIWLDGRIKSNAPAQGFCPATADAILYSPDFGTFWGQALNTEQVQRVRADWRRADAGIELSVRNLTGVRPTPSRWRLWMGRRFLAASTPHGYGVCTYPGLLLRGASYLHGWLRDPIDSSGVRTYGDIHFAWRDGFLIASKNPDYVRAALQSDPITMNSELSPRALVLESRADPVMSLEIHAADEFPIYGRLASAIHSRSAPMTLPSAWRSAPMAACSASTWEDVAALLEVADAALSHTESWPAIRSAGTDLVSKWDLSPPPPAWTDERLDHCSLVLKGFDIASNVPYPELAFVVRSTLPAAGTHPLANVLSPEIEGIPYEWGGYPGTLYPMAGAQWAPCLGHEGRDWLAASRERVMRDLVGNLDDGTPVHADFTMQVDWQQVSAAFVQLLTQIEDLELVHERNRDEVRAALVPIAQATRHLGRTVISGTQAEDVVLIEGRLARRVPETAS